MSTVEVKILGLDELQRKLEEMPKEVSRKVLHETLKDVGEEMREFFVAHAPVSNDPRDTPGFLKEHFNVKIGIHSGEVAGAAYIGPAGNMDYPRRGHTTVNRKHPVEGRTIAVASVARFLEFGTSKMQKHPFMTEAFDGHKEEALEHIINDIKQTIEKYTK